MAATSVRKRPLMALVLSVLCPGLGQLYNTQRAKGLTLAVVGILLAAGTWWLSGLNRITMGLALCIVWVSGLVDAYQTAKASGRSADWYYRKPYVVTMLLLVGPLALLLLWRSPHFSSLARWIWTLVVVGGLLIVVAIPSLVSFLIQSIPELETLLHEMGLSP